MIYSTPVGFVLLVKRRAQFERDIGSNCNLVTVSGLRMRSVRELMDELDDKLGLPDYFGHNWDALDEVLGEFDWNPDPRPVLLLIERPALILHHEAIDQLKMFLSVLQFSQYCLARPMYDDEPQGSMYPVLIVGEQGHEGPEMDVIHYWLSEGWELVRATGWRRP